PVQPLTASQREEVTGLLSWMETSLGRIKLRWTPMEPAEYELLVNGKALKESAIWLPAGTHRVVVRARGFGSVDRTITLAPEQHEVIELTLQKSEPPAVAVQPKPKRKPAVAPVDAAHSLPAPDPATATNIRHTEQRDSDPSDGGSVLTRWWFWTAVAAVAAGGVVTAVLLSQPAPISPVDTSEMSETVVLRREGLR
ncbi:MAG TPA: carboxypeptidase-like regulatory domain-containing protein, partial [Polyangiales bacterium]|nr:carboxypeptidase-like regulatory domain-containing protein [Polyangiales bacterium]